MPDTTVFQSGNSQAVRLPKEFRFSSKTVEIFRRGDEVVLREKKRSFGEALQHAFADLPPLTDGDVRAFDEAMKQARESAPAQERDWSLLSDDRPETPTFGSPRLPWQRI
jgi:antitoxin VapB